MAGPVAAASRRGPLSDAWQAKESTRDEVVPADNGHPNAPMQAAPAVTASHCCHRELTHEGSPACLAASRFMNTRSADASGRFGKESIYTPASLQAGLQHWVTTPPKWRWALWGRPAEAIVGKNGGSENVHHRKSAGSYDGMLKNCTFRFCSWTRSMAAAWMTPLRRARRPTRAKRSE
jgi:hypothetical protein